MSLQRTIVLGTALILLASALLAAQVFRVNTEARDLGGAAPPPGWIVGPKSESLERAASTSLDEGLRALNDTSLPPAQRLESYRDHLTRGERLLVRALRAHASDARVIALVAAVRWELKPPLDIEERRRHMELVTLASAIAPDVPAVQLQLGELLLRMTLPEEALQMIGRALELDPSMSAAVVDELRNYLFSAEQILEGLPPIPEVLIALRGPFTEDSDQELYLEALEQSLRSGEGRSSQGILSAYGNVCLGITQPTRLHDRMNALDAIDDPAVEALRWYLLARASLALKQPSRSINEARHALRVSVGSPSLAEGVGDVAMAASEPALAVEAFQGALATIARTSGDSAARARLYAKIGRAEEARGDFDRAFDLYGISLRLDPTQPLARERLVTMEGAAGISDAQASQ